VTPERRVRLERLGALGAVLLAVAAIGLWHPGERSPFWQGIEGRLLDARFLLRGPLPAPPQVAIVAFDDAAFAKLATFPPSRTALGAVVADVWAAGARSQALDFLVVDPRGDDAALAGALARGTSVLAVAEAAAGATAGMLHGRSGFALATGPAASSPLPALAPPSALQEAADLGHVTVEHDPDGSLRRMRPSIALMTAQGLSQVPGLAVTMVAAQAGPARYLARADGIGGRLEIGTRSIPLDLGGAVPLDYYGPAGSIRTYSAASVTEADLRGKLVFLGATAIGFGDRHATPFDAILPGVEVHATFAANLLTGRALRRDALAWTVGVGVAAMAAVAGFAAAWPRHRLVALLAMGLAVSTVALTVQLAFLAGWWLDATTILMALALGTTASAALQQFNQRRRATNLARYQSPILVETLALSAEPLKDSAPQPAVVLFVDIAAFTPHAERVGPQVAHTVLTVFTRLVEAVADRSGGMVADYAGDGALVVFGVPQPGPADGEHATQFIDRLYAAVRDAPDWPGLGLRVSGHQGLVRLGVMGGDRHRRVSVTGDVVNTASRLQDCARSSGTSLALSDAFVAGSPATRRWAERAGLGKLAPQQLRGRVAIEEVWVGESVEGR
jgi:adenylate cyclase